MNHLQNTRFLRALQRQPVDRTPAWIMRQAGRYLPEYRALRKQAGDFLQMVKNPEMACQITLQPIERFPLDAAIIFSDILTIPDAMQLGLKFIPGQGPVFESPLRSLADIQQLPTLTISDELDYVGDAITTTVQHLAGKCPLIGFTGSPWTLATYMVEGGSSKTFSLIKGLMYSEPQAMQLLLDKLVVAVADYLLLQVQAGADVLMIFDTWGGVLSSEAYQQFSLQAMTDIIRKVRAVHAQVPIIVFTKNGGQWLELMLSAQPTALGIDWTTDIGDAFQRVGQQVALQGNLDPAVLFADETAIEHQVRLLLDKVAGRSGHIFNLGHGMQPTMSAEKLSYLLAVLQQYSNNPTQSN